MSQVDINKQNNEGNTPIHLASQQGHLDTINLLINKAKLDIKNNQNETVLHAGAKSHSEEAAEVVRKFYILYDYNLRVLSWLQYVQEISKSFSR